MSDAPPVPGYGERVSAAIRRAGIGNGAEMPGLIAVWDRVLSTNVLAKELARNAVMEEGIFVAAEQTAGRGTEGRDWVSPRGGIYLSILASMEEARDPDRSGLIPIAAGVAVAEALSEASGTRVALRWPNDLDGSRGKLGGILVEAGFAARHPELVVVGIGVNIGRPPAVADAPVAPDGLPESVVREEAVAAIFAAFGRVRNTASEEVISRWERLSPTGRGCPCVLRLHDGTEVSGETDGLHPSGALRVRLGTETRIVHASDAVSIQHRSTAG